MASMLTALAIAEKSLKLISENINFVFVLVAILGICSYAKISHGKRRVGKFYDHVFWGVMRFGAFTPVFLFEVDGNFIQTVSVILLIIMFLYLVQEQEERYFKDVEKDHRDS